MKLIYIAGPFRAENAWEVERNIRRAEEMAFRVASETGAAFVCPHTNSRFFDGTIHGRYWLDATLEIMRRCDAVMVLPGHESSEGTLGEIAEATRLGIPVFYEFDELAEWARAHATQDAFAGLVAR